jgi:oxygen-independent coproporphyrinogen-3 oxidase
VLDLRDYYTALDAGRPATYRGYRTTPDDRLRRAVIMQLMCHFALDVAAVEHRFEIDFAAYFAGARAQLEAMEADGLVALAPRRIEVTPRGRFFVRNIAMAFDAYLAPTEARPMYSQTV